ncbi:hypothetical protein M8C11_06185 [Micromonospora sp. CPM1]|uniref:hypothetical protein n=1 Tax=Micromonospora sp. CPM1 TaxID=2944809 RepID=UPI00207D47A9|nr:hypothetical protein [Micromonospora sp. CPM1]MCO1614295.1 hypothetical protein [Micromonospora sp. CPM1]
MLTIRLPRRPVVRGAAGQSRGSTPRRTTRNGFELRFGTGHRIRAAIHFGDLHF